MRALLHTNMASHVAKVYGMHSAGNNAFNAHMVTMGPAMSNVMMHVAKPMILRYVFIIITDSTTQ